MSGVLRELQQQREGVLRHGARAVGRHVRHHDAALLRCFDIDDVVAGGGHADALQLRERLDLCAMQHGLVCDGDLRVRGAHGNIAWRRAVKDLARAKRLQFIPAQVAGVQCVSVEDNDVHGQYFAAAWPLPRPSALVISIALPSMKPASLITAMNCQPSAMRRCACAASVT